MREATVEDVPAVRTVAERAWRAAYASVLREATVDRVLEEWYDPALVRRVVESEDTTYLVACGPDGGVLGYAAGATTDGHGGEVPVLYVDPDHWGEGVGTRLFETVLDALREQGVDRVEITVLADNDVGRSFYESRGFDVCEAYDDDLFGETVRTLTYERAL